MQTVVTSGAHIGMFLLTFSKWWYSQDMSDQSKYSQTIKPPISIGASNTPEASKKGACPICKMSVCFNTYFFKAIFFYFYNFYLYTEENLTKNISY